MKFSESPEGKVICMMAIKFRHEEKFAIEKCQALVTDGNIDGMPVDDHFFRVNCKYIETKSKFTLEKLQNDLK